MPSPIKLTKADARRVLVRHHFTPCANQVEVFQRLRSIQFDPIAPVGCNHDLVLQSRVAGYKIGDWQKTAYEDRRVYDGWDKMASLVPFEGWPVRRIFHDVHRKMFEEKIFKNYAEAVKLVLKELEDRGPLMPKELEFQERREDWKVGWFGPNVSKQILRALWHSGQVMTAGRKGGQHIYDLTERIMPEALFTQPRLPHDEAVRELALERHRAMGFLRAAASPEVWSNQVLNPHKNTAIKDLADRGEIVPVEVEGMKVHATPHFLKLLDQPSLEPRALFVAPLDQFMWDRKMTAHLFSFEYIWEIYVKEHKRRWGYYVLPILYGDHLVARAEFYCRSGELEVREWHQEEGELTPAFWEAFEAATRDFMRYASAKKITARDHVPAKVRKFFASIKEK